VIQKSQDKTLRPFLFSTFVVVIFFCLLEMILHFSGFQPSISYKKFVFPAWMEELDPLVLAKYQSYVAEQGFVNEDVYAYRPDLRYGYLLKPHLQITVSNYSSAIFFDKLPPWTIASDAKGYRVSAQNPEVKGKAARTLHVLGDSSSFGWGVNFEDSYPHMLAEKLKQLPKTSGITVKNYSTPGFTSYHGRLLLEDKVKIKNGDIVLISFGSNDSYPSLKSDSVRFQTRNSMVGKISWFLNRLLIIKGMRTLIHSLPEPRIPKTKNSRVSLEDYQKNIGAIFTEILQRGGKPHFVSICNREDYRDVARQTAKSAHIPFYDFPETFNPYLSKVHDLFPEKLVTYFEAYGKVLEKETQLAFLFPDLCHPNTIGHGLMANILFERFEREVLN
jgi:lysophospholipase L1-like esterase